jgi:hypothetical protein
MILFFDRRLERLPPGWNGTVRMKIAHESTAAGKTETEQVTLGMERQAPVRSVRQRTPVGQLLENAIAQELHRMRLRLVDPTFAERALASQGKGGDTEFDSIKGAARYVFEVELAATGEAVWMIGELKSVGGGEIVATVRQPVEHDLHDPGDADALARAFVKRLLESPAVDP